MYNRACCSKEIKIASRFALSEAAVTKKERRQTAGSTQLLGPGSKLYLSNMQCMLNKVLTGFMQILSQANERKAILTWCHIFNLCMK